MADRVPHSTGASLVLLAALACNGACRGELGDAPPTAATGSRAGASRQIAVRGAGGSFPYPAYSKWAFRFFETTGTRVGYEQLGSEAGVAAVKQNKVHFGASDMPLTEEELEAAGLVQFPLLVGGVVLVANLPGVEPGDLQLSADMLVDIYLGRITRWTADEIRRANPHVDLPDREIVPIYRSDSSGTTWVFTRFLAGRSSAWKQAVGMGPRVAWPVGVGAESNDQVARFVQRFKYTLAYVEYSHARSQNLTWLALGSGPNAPPKRPTLAAFERGAKNASWSATPSVRFEPSLVEDPAEWPILGASYVLIKSEQRSRKRARQMLEFFGWALTEGTQIARELDYAPIPQEQAKQIGALWRTRVRAEGEQIW